MPAGAPPFSTQTRLNLTIFARELISSMGGTGGRGPLGRLARNPARTRPRRPPGLGFSTRAGRVSGWACIPSLAGS